MALLNHICVLSLVLIATYYQLAEGTVTFSLRLDSYSNPGSRLASGRCCDDNCTNSCDYYFTICLDDMDSITMDMQTCPLGRYVTGAIQDQSNIIFTDNIGGASNPHISRPSSWPGGFLLKVEVMDQDMAGSGELVENMLILIDIGAADNATSVNLGNWTTLVVTVDVSCDADYYGENCSQLCAPDWNDRYTCDPVTGAKICEEDYYGPTCIQYCSTTNTRGDGEPHFTCDPITGERICHHGWGGYSCNRRITDPCDNLPCLNEATCTGDIQTQEYTCHCADRWKGAHCERREDCRDDPCRGPADCLNITTGFHCFCNDGWEGVRCEDMLDLCLSQPCRNGGTCVEHRTEDDASYQCTCPPGYGGYDCHRDVNECNSNPCNGSQSCRNLRGSFECYCANDGEGEDCFVPLMTPETSLTTAEMAVTSDVPDISHPCLNHLCANNGTCIVSQSGDRYTCNCTEGYRGPGCELVDYCTSNPCAEAQPCVNTDDGFSCQCDARHTGPTCADLISTTQTVPITTIQEDERPHWLYAVPRTWIKETSNLELLVHRVACIQLKAFSKDVTTEVDEWECSDYEKSDEYQLISVVIRIRGHIQSERNTLAVLHEVTGMKSEMEVLVGNETTACHPVVAPKEGAVLSAKDRQELLYVIGSLLIMATIALIVATAIIITRRQRGVYVPTTEAAPSTKEEEARRKLVVLRNKDLKLDVARANRRNTNRDSKIQDDFVPQCYVNLIYDEATMPPVTPEDNPPSASPRPISIYKKFHYENK